MRLINTGTKPNALGNNNYLSVRKIVHSTFSKNPLSIIFQKWACLLPTFLSSSPAKSFLSFITVSQISGLYIIPTLAIV